MWDPASRLLSSTAEEKQDAGTVLVCFMVVFQKGITLVLVFGHIQKHGGREMRLAGAIPRFPLF
jgi:hypothetical protein